MCVAFVENRGVDVMLSCLCPTKKFSSGVQGLQKEFKTITRVTILVTVRPDL